MEYESKFLSKDFKERVWPLFSATIKRANSRNQYFKVVTDICNFAQKDFLKLSKNDAQAFFDMYTSGRFKKSNGSPYDNTTIFIKYTYLRSIANFIIENEKMFAFNYYSPFGFIKIKEPPGVIDTKKILSAREISGVLEKIYGTQAFFIFSFAFRLGMSNEELIALTPSCVIQDGSGTLALMIPAKRRNEPTRYIKIPDDMKDIFLSYYKSVPMASKTLFYNTRLQPLNARSIQRMTRNALIAAGLPASITLQSLRSSAAYTMLKNGASYTSIAEQLGVGERWIYRYSKALDDFSDQASEKVKIEMVKTPIDNLYSIEDEDGKALISNVDINAAKQMLDYLAASGKTEVKLVKNKID